VWDWDEFQKIPTCAVGCHTDVESDKPEFWKSSTVDNASKGINNFQDPSKPKVVIKSIVDYEADEKKKEDAKKKAEDEAEKVPFVTKDGFYKCINKGCLKKYKPEDNNDKACSYHPGEAMFHDLKKWYTCCNVETWDWDAFMKLPTCTVGRHKPKMAIKK
jgi:disease resistance protein